ncbi:zf-TFIIB domain-containing protein [Actinosynnema sp. NPDC020468]|uniref:TFIIB-type zinc ribbon-containing protein n=1 Tax=Actinosynnema sp. NPDC020468 TaxID=3154488 RepID=UPI0033C71F8F
MICPKCADLMKTITRGAVHIEQCDNCKGVFLDGGELEQIVAAERDHYAQPAPYGGRPAPYDAQPAPYPGQPAPYSAPPASPGGAPPPYQPPPGTGVPPPVYPGGHPGYGYPPRRRSFLEDLFD